MTRSAATSPAGTAPLVSAVTEQDDIDPGFSWGKFNVEMRALYKHEACYFCGEHEACFCEQCIAPTWEEVGHLYCHLCHREHVDVDGFCPTCKQRIRRSRR